MLVFGELCCGMSAVSLALFGGAPPVSRMGSKTGYAKTILRVLGIRPGSGADLVLLNDPDEDIARLWACLMDEEHRQQVVDQIKAWIPCPTGGYECPGCDRCSHKKGRWDARDLWETLKADRKADRKEGPKEVARWLFMANTAYRAGHPEHGGFVQPGSDRLTMEGLNKRLLSLSPIPALVSNLPAEQYQPMEFEGRRVIYIDPPYQNTKGYRHKFPREAVIRVAERWFRAGWEVVISEAEPIDIEGWYHVDIGGERTGQKRTFSRQQSEWLTMSSKPEWKPSTQMGLF